MAEWITVQLKIVSQAPDLRKPEALLSRLSFHLRRMVRIDAEISTSVRGSSLGVDGVCCPSRDDKTSRKEFGIQFQGHQLSEQQERAAGVCPVLQ
jgi:hypothetical protein